MRQQALHVLELHRSTPRPPPRGGGGPFTFTFLSGGELPTSAGGARGGAPGGGASMGSHDVFLTSLQDSAYEGFAKFDSNSGTSQVRTPRPARPRRHPSLEGASQQAGRRGLGAGRGPGTRRPARLPPGGTRERGGGLSRSLYLASLRRSHAAGAPGRVLLSRTGLGRPGCHRRGPLLRPGGKGARRRASRPLSPAPTRRRRRPCRPPRGALPSGQPGADRVGGGGRGLLLSHSPPHFLPPRPRPRSRSRSRWTPPPCGARR